MRRISKKRIEELLERRFEALESAIEEKNVDKFAYQWMKLEALREFFRSKKGE